MDKEYAIDVNDPEVKLFMRNKGITRAEVIAK